jgi:hypothetical protein
VAHDGTEGLSPDGWLPDRISVGALTKAFPPELVDAIVAATDTREVRRRLLPARLVVYFVLALWLFRGRNCGYGQVMIKLADGLYHRRRGEDLLAGQLDPAGWVDAGAGRRWRPPNISSGYGADQPDPRTPTNVSHTQTTRNPPEMSDPTVTVSTRTTTEHSASTRRGAVRNPRFHAGHLDTAEHRLDPGVVEHGVKQAGELAVAVPDQESRPTAGVLEIHDEVLRGLGDPGCSGVRGCAQDPDPPGGVLDDRQHVQAGSG